MPEGIYMGTRLSAAAGYLIWEEDGKKTQIAIEKILRAADIPMLTYEQVSSIATLSNMFVVLIRTLQAKGIVDEDFLEKGEFDISMLIQSLENMGGSYTDPDLNVLD
uniref:Uncharacterized protein n=1 Tax=viral metagenome TaxID=1070528 RepID=A0A6H2A0L3_9ZZZZ